MPKRITIIITIVFFLIGSILSFFMQILDRNRSDFSTKNESNGIHRAPTRIICTAPSIVETVFALGEIERIVGISDFTTYPPQILKTERIGGYLNPDFEQIIHLRPDLLITQGGMQKHEDFCKEKKIPLLRVDMESLDSIYQGFRQIGEALQCPQKAEKLIQETREALHQIENRAQALSLRPSIFISMGRKAGSLTGIYTMHPTSFINELVKIAGGNNIFDDLVGRYPQISKESLLKRNPDWILELHPGEVIAPDLVHTFINDWRSMPSLAAVAKERISIVTDDFLLIPGPRIVQTAQRFFDIIHEIPDRHDSNP
mgnify:CR=1 FL=1